MNQDLIREIGREIRKLLVKEFPDSPNLEKQCKRASILFAEACKQLGIPVSILSGHISKENDNLDREKGHVWNVIQLENEPWVVDLSLTQFSSYLGHEVPSVFLVPASSKKDLYMYTPDGLGEYTYIFGDVRFNLIQSVNQLIDTIKNRSQQH